MPRSFASPRRRSCSSAVIREQPEQPGNVRAKLLARNDRVDMAEAVVRLREAEVVGELLAGRLLHDAWAGEREQRAGLGHDHVTQRARSLRARLPSSDAP